MPTKHKGFCAKLGPRGKSRSLQGLFESSKQNRGSHAFFEIISFEFNKNADISIFLKKEGNNIISQISYDSPLHTDRQTNFKRSLNYTANGNIIIIFGTFLIPKSLQKRF